ncbi:aspartate aminotransferase [Nitratiruptor sp. YY08-26]|uniref:pyridoxal phosphate-dependent aminotransferase n=1 Tax=unclassified Nitratiruptor TaxID=2624044 RepID=UPI001914DEDE|nr:MULTISPECIES: aminotransferase class I/II-fold pyridoxal phosphate-dependent enzyme [unclassified Nitratiruptor]BCD62462.1 aspartate aminotransferase [Nitratiruptor sp. YY08-13]BCD66398.1 aspartate aminotransferase [Nitratiruptor sp. YY08-26]
MQRVKNLTPFMVMAIAKEASKYKDAIHFEIGEPDLPPPPGVVEAAKCALDNYRFSYTISEGLPALRQKIADFYKKRYNILINPENILITPGTSGAFMLAYALTLDFGNSLAFSDPGYPSYKNFAYILGIEPRFIPVDSTTSYCITPEHLHKNRPHALQISNPANPTGNIYEIDLLQDLCTYCLHKNITLISDELYHGLIYDVNTTTALAFNEEAIIINGFSKYFCMPGMRIGWIIVPSKLRKKAIEIAQNIFIAAPTLSQYAALEAFDEEYLASVTLTYRKRRDYLYQELSKLFYIPHKPQGAFYIWADISKYSDNALHFANHLLQKTHVAVTPGVDFGFHNTDKFVRFAYTKSIEHMEQGVKRLKSLLG